MIGRTLWFSDLRSENVLRLYASHVSNAIGDVFYVIVIYVLVTKHILHSRISPQIALTCKILSEGTCSLKFIGLYMLF